MTTLGGPVEAARALAPAFRERAAEGEAGRTMPADLVERVREAGLFHLGLPASVGGSPVEPAVAIEAFEEVSAADGSMGWTVLIGNTTAFVAWLEPSVAKDLVAAKPRFTAAGAFMASGQAVADGNGGFTVSGRWPFTSGAPHADWFSNGVVIMDGDRPRMHGERPDWRFAWIPSADVEVLDTWHAAGLRGTGSHDTAVAGATVPEDLTTAPLWDPAKADDPVFRIPFLSLLNVFITGFALGVTRRAIEEFVVLAQRKSRRADGARMADDETIQVEVARMEARYRAARAYVFDTVGDLWSTVTAGDDVTPQQRASVLLANQHSFRAGIEVVDAAFRFAGGGALYESSPLQRCFRDLHAANQHIALSLPIERVAGQVIFGSVPRTPFL